jgi:hypothetical protein
MPDSTSAMNAARRILFGVIIGGYLISAIVLMWQNHSRAGSEAKSRFGLNAMLWGTILGFLPVVAGIVTSIFSPQTVLPGSDYYFLAMVLIPITWSAAARKSAG